MATGTNSLELVVLGLLKEQDMHGYELKKRMTESLEPIVRVSWGSLYPALARLEGRGALKAVESKPGIPKVPMTGSLGGEKAAFRAHGDGSKGLRNKKIYGITDRGKVLFDQMLNDDGLMDEKSFAIRLAFAKHLEPSKRLAMLKDRRDQINAKVRSNVRNSEKKRYSLEPYVELVLEHFRSTSSSELVWIDGLIKKEEAAMLSLKEEPMISSETQGS